MPSERIPPASDFSPGILGGCIKRVLEVIDSESTRAARQEAIRAAFFTTTAPSQQMKRAGNVLLSLPHYGLADAEGQPTILAEMLMSLTDEDADAEFARHCLDELRGIDVLRAISDLHKQHVLVTKESLQAAHELGFGLRLSRNTTDHMTLLNWMRRGGVLTQSRSYEIDEAKVAALANFALSDLDEWQGMPLPQRAFLVSLRRLSDGEGPIPLAAKRVKDLAEIEYGPLFTSSRSRQLVQDPLEAAGWIVSSGGTGGRGAKGGLVEATPRLMNIDLDAILGFPVPALPADLRTQLNRPLAEVERDLRASSTFVAGVALELLALKMSVALGLIPVELRKRDDKTGGGEVDLLAEGAHLHFSRWLFQCKNQRAAVPLSALAKEIGMAVLLKAQVIVLATTGRFASSVYEHADQVAETTAMQVVLIDGAGLRQYLRNGDAALQHFFRTKAAETLALKQLQRLVRGEG